MFPCYGCHYMQRIFKTPRLRSEVYRIKASSSWSLRGSFLIQLLPLEYTRSSAVCTHEELELATEASPGTGIFPPLGLHILSPVLFYFLLFSLSRSNLQTSCLHALLGMAQSLPILWTSDACLVILLPKKRLQLAREKYSALPGSGPSFAWWERTGIIWYYHRKTSTLRLLLEEEGPEREPRRNHDICLQCDHLETVFQCLRGLGKTHIATADKFTCWGIGENWTY